MQRSLLINLAIIKETAYLAKADTSPSKLARSIAANCYIRRIENIEEKIQDVKRDYLVQSSSTSRHEHSIFLETISHESSFMSHVSCLLKQPPMRVRSCLMSRACRNDVSCLPKWAPMRIRSCLMSRACRNELLWEFVHVLCHVPAETNSHESSFLSHVYACKTETKLISNKLQLMTLKLNLVQPAMNDIFKHWSIDAHSRRSFRIMLSTYIEQLIHEWRIVGRRKSNIKHWILLLLEIN